MACLLPASSTPVSKVEWSSSTELSHIHTRHVPRATNIMKHDFPIPDLADAAGTSITHI